MYMYINIYIYIYIYTCKHIYIYIPIILLVYYIAYHITLFANLNVVLYQISSLLPIKCSLAGIAEQTRQQHTTNRQ